MTTETEHVQPTGRDWDLAKIVADALNVAIEGEGGHGDEIYSRMWWQLRLNHTPKESLRTLAEEALAELKKLDPSFTLEVHEGDEAVYFNHPDLSRPIEVLPR